MNGGRLRNDFVPRTATSLRTLFKPGSWLSKIDFVNHLVLFNNILITVLAEKEGGKTCFCSLLLNNLDPQINSVFISTKPLCSREDIVNDIASQLHLNLEMDSNILSIVSQINERKTHVLVIIDDAQHVPEQLIKDFLIAIRNQEQGGFFHLCLVSDYSVVATLNNFTSEQFANLVHTIELGALNEAESRTYVLQRAMTGRLINKPLTDAQFKQFYQSTKGNIAKINSNIESFVSKCAHHQDKSKTKVIASISVVVCLLVLTSVTYFYLNRSSVQGKDIEAVLTTALTSTHTQAPLAKDTVQQEASLDLPSLIPALYEGSVTEIATNQLLKKQIIATDNTVESVVEKPDPADNLSVIPEIDKGVIIVNEARIAALTKNHQDQVQELAKKASANINSATRSPKIVLKKNIGSNIAAKYTIQIAASHSKSDIYRFQQSNKLASKTKIRHFTNQKGSWFILTLGEYSTRTQALNSANNLPKNIAKLNPWIRPVSGLKSLG